MKPTTENGIFTATDVSIWIQRGDIKYNDKLILLSEHNCQIDALKCIVLENQKHRNSLQRQIEELKEKIMLQEYTQQELIRAIPIDKEKLIKYILELKQEVQKDYIKKSDVQEYLNPYPKDVFSWDNKEKIDFNRGRFHQFCFELVEHIKVDLLNHTHAVAKATKSEATTKSKIITHKKSCPQELREPTYIEGQSPYKYKKR